MENESLKKRVLYLREVEGMSQRQIARLLGIDRKRIRRIFSGHHSAQAVSKDPILEPYRSLIAHWYGEYPRLKATQIYERLKSYGSLASYPSVARFTRQYRRLKPVSYHTLDFVPGEEAQVDWFFFKHESLGQVAGFLYVLAYSRYAWGGFYPRTSFEFFLKAHLDVFEHLGGLAHRHRYDNLKSVVLRREPVLEYNPQFLDFSRFFGFSIYVCHPYSGNEKGRVERPIRDIRVFLYGQTFSDLRDLNLKFHGWLEAKNKRIHRTTAKPPRELLPQERLLKLPEGAYPARRVEQARVSKTALVEFETNRYSVPSTCASKQAEILVFPDRIEIYVSGSKVATHKRSLERKKLIQNPLHAERLLTRTPQFKYQRIRQLIRDMDPIFRDFLGSQDNETEETEAAYELFGLLKTHSRGLLVSALKELLGMRCYKIKALQSLLHLPCAGEEKPVWPRNQALLKLQYEPRRLNDYDPHQ